MSSTEALQPLGDCVLYAIDVHLPIWKSVLKAVAHSITSLQQLGDRKFQVGVTLFGLDAKPTPTSLLSKRASAPIVSGCCALVPLHQSTVEDVKKLLQLAEEDLPTKCAPTSESLLTLAQGAKLEFYSQKVRLFNRLVIFSDSDPQFPASEFPELQVQFQSIAGLDVLVVPVLFTDQHDQEDFASEFWSQIPYMPSNMTTAALNSGLRVSLNPVCLSTLDEDHLVERLDLLVRQKAERKRVEFRGVLTCQSMRIGVCGYSVASSPRPKYQGLFVRGANGYERVHRVYAETDMESAHREYVLNPGIGGIEVNAEDVEELRTVLPSDEPPQIHIHSFLPPQECQMGTHYRLYRSLFIVPSNFRILQSKDAFASLHRSMVRKQVVALASYIPNQRGRSPMLGFLYAFDPATATNAHSSHPSGPSPLSGMYFVKLPFSQDIRGMQMVQDGKTPANGRLEQRMAKLVKKFYFEPGFDPQLFSNPSSEQFAKVLGHLALGPLQCPPEQLTNEKGNDNTLPNYKSIKRHAGKLCIKVDELLIPEDHAGHGSFDGIEINDSIEQKEAVQDEIAQSEIAQQQSMHNDFLPTKIKSNESNESEQTDTKLPLREFSEESKPTVKGPLKRPFASTSMGETTPSSRRGILNTYRLPDLRAQLIELGMDPRGKKHDLVERLARYYDNVL